VSALRADVEPEARRYTKLGTYRETARLDDWAAGVFNAPMRKFIGILSCAILLAGCASNKSATAKQGQQKPVPNKPVVTPDFRPVGKVARVNKEGRFVVISFPPGQMPRPQAPLNVYRNGLKVAEVNVDPRWQNDNNVVADILTGEVQVDDEVRQN
jgi:hypothetical protein